MAWGTSHSRWLCCFHKFHTDADKFQFVFLPFYDLPNKRWAFKLKRDFKHLLWHKGEWYKPPTSADEHKLNRVTRWHQESCCHAIIAPDKTFTYFLDSPRICTRFTTKCYRYLQSVLRKIVSTIDSYLVTEDFPHDSNLITVDATTLPSGPTSIGNITRKLQQIFTADVLPECSPPLQFI